MSLKSQAFIAFQYLVPQHALSRLVGKIAASEVHWVKNAFINYFIGKFGINMNEAKLKSADDFRSFNDFFTRELAVGVRPIAQSQVVSPADGAISQLGKIEEGRIFQAKGQDYSVLELLGGNKRLADEFMGGEFATIYLSPKDYHRVHMPMTGTLREMIYVPGDLFSVNQTTAENVPRLFSRNERLVAIFDTDHGPMAMVLVGAMIVAAIETVWAGRITPASREKKVTDYANLQPIHLEQAAEMGRFLLGSTVVLCFAKDQIHWLDSLKANSPLKMGQALTH
ncbi:MAG: phosphatidylserine decarboxylase [Pseudomonadota bacterium]|jgi:phosphatidylserine decarboxylase